MTVKAVTDILETLAPLSWAEDFDNVGLLVGDKNMEVSGVLVCLDSLENVVDEAINKNCNMIVSFHPIIFSGLKKLNREGYVSQVAIKAIQNNIAIYSMHTALDNAVLGVNYEICQRLGLEQIEVLMPNEEITPKDPNGTLGMGRTGVLKNPLSEAAFLHLLKESFGTPCIRHSVFRGRDIKKIAVIGGSGAFGIEAAKIAKADVFVTADLKYHDFFKAENNILLIDIGHYESEQFTKNLLVGFLTKKIANFAIALSESNTNPVKYY
jgi:dinuclear metal center YbgI/SA1388 family protein